MTDYQNSTKFVAFNKQPFTVKNVIMRLIFVILFLMVVCKGGKKSFNNDHGLKWHRTSCKPAKQFTAGLFQKRKDLQNNLKRTYSHAPRISLNTDEAQMVVEMVEIIVSSIYFILIYLHSQTT